MTAKRQKARFPAGSVNMYSTLVTPTVNLSPGERSDVLVTVPPELSVAVGGVQVTSTDVAPPGAVVVMP